MVVDDGQLQQRQRWKIKTIFDCCGGKAMVFDNSGLLRFSIVRRWGSRCKTENYATIKLRVSDNDNGCGWGQLALAFDSGNGRRGQRWQWTITTAFDRGGNEQAR